MIAKYELVKFENGMLVTYSAMNYIEAIVHWHNEIELIFIISGKLNFSVDGENHIVSEGEIAVINSEQLHSCISDTERKSKYLLLQINSLFFKNLNIDINLIYYSNVLSSHIDSKFYFPHTKDLFEYSQIITKILENKKNNYRSQISLSCGNIISCLQNCQIARDSIDNNNSLVNINRIKTIFKFIEANYTEDISITDLAEVENLSAYYLSHCFKQYTNTTFLNYLNNYRISKIQTDLLTTQDSITDIYLRHGFTNSKTFNRLFSKYMGCPPSEFRKGNVTKPIDQLHLQQNTEVLQTTVGTYVTYNDYIKANEKEFLSSVLNTNQKVEIPAIIDEKEIIVDITAPIQKYDKYYKLTTCTGRAHDILKARFREHFELVQEVFHFESIRFHGIFNDEIGIITTKKEELFYNFFFIDEIFDYLLSKNCKPYIEIGFMPSQIKTNDNSIFFYKGNVSPPKSESDWISLIKAFMSHIIKRYGKKEVLTWYFEIWNEADLKDFWSGTIEEYFNFYKYTVETIKSFDYNLMVGGPSGSSESLNNDFVLHFLDYCKKHHLPIDFFTFHPYPTQVITDKRKKERIEYILPPDSLNNYIEKTKNLLEHYNYIDSEIHFNEWNSSSRTDDYVHDTAYMATFILQNIIANMNKINSLAYWTFSDIMDEDGIPFNEFAGKFGMINRSGLKKPSFFAFEALDKLSDEILQKGNDYIITKTDIGIQILLWNYCHFNKEYASGDKSNLTYHDRYQIFDISPNKKFNITINTLKRTTCKIETSIFTRNHGSIFDFWLKNGAPEYLTKQQLDLFKENNHLLRKVEYIETQDTLNIFFTVEPFGFTLLEIDYID